MEKVRVWWKHNLPTMLLPPLYAGHEHRWHRLDMDCVVCTLCGVPHICGHTCNIVPCIEHSEGHESICMITGVVTNSVKMYDTSIAVNDFQVWLALFVGFGFDFFNVVVSRILHSCHGQFLRYKARSYRAPLLKPLSFYAFLSQVHIFALPNYAN